LIRVSPPIIAALLLVVSAACRFDEPVPRADFIIHHAVVHTAGVPETAEAVAVRAGRFIAVGSNTAALDLKGPNTRVIDAGGRAVLPGFFGRVAGIGDSDSDDDILRADMAARQLGVTTVETGATPALVDRYKRLIDQGRVKTRTSLLLRGSLDDLGAEFAKGPTKDYAGKHLMVQTVAFTTPVGAEAMAVAAARAGFQIVVFADDSHARADALGLFERLYPQAPVARNLRLRVEPTPAKTVNPILEFQVALGQHSRSEAVKAVTWDAAYSALAEQELGSIEPGKFGDLTMLDRDITSIDAGGIGQTVVQLTVVGGNIVYEKNTQK